MALPIGSYGKGPAPKPKAPPPKPVATSTSSGANPRGVAIAPPSRPTVNDIAAQTLSTGANPRGVAIASSSAPLVKAVANARAPKTLSHKPPTHSQKPRGLQAQVALALKEYDPQGVQGLLSSSHSVPSGNVLGTDWKGASEFGPLFDSFNPTAKAPGLVVPGNIDPYTRPVAHNADGSISTVRSITLTGDDGRAILLPTVTPDGRVVSDAKAIALWQRTGQHLGIFKNETLADRYAESLHNQQAQEYLPALPKRRRGQ